VLVELAVDPPLSAGFAIYLFVHGHALGAVVMVVFTLIALVQAAIYAPRALDAAQRQHVRDGWH
jgi:hypothetical protein